MTVYPNLNLIDGTKDFSGSWEHSDVSVNDGTYQGLTVKKRTSQWVGINKTFTAPKDGVYTFSAYVKSSGNKANATRFVLVNDSPVVAVPDKIMGNDFGWLRDSVSVTLKAGDKVSARYDIAGSSLDSALWNAGHKWEHGSTATLYMPSLSEVTAEDYPSYIGTYTDNDSNTQSTDPGKYTWKKIVE